MKFPAFMLMGFLVSTYGLTCWAGRVHERAEQSFKRLGESLQESRQILGEMDDAIESIGRSHETIDQSVKRMKRDIRSYLISREFNANEIPGKAPFPWFVFLLPPKEREESAEELPFPRYMASDIPWGPHVVAMYQHRGMLPGEFWTFEQIESAWAEGDPSIIRIVPPDWRQGVAPVPELIPAPKKESHPCEN